MSTQAAACMPPTGSGIINVWPRHSSSKGPTDSSTNDGTDVFCKTTYSVNQNIVTVTATTHVYYVLNKVGSSLFISQYSPFDATQVKKAYSIHVSTTPLSIGSAVQRYNWFILSSNPTTYTTTLRCEGKPLQDPVVEVVDIIGRLVYH